MWRLFFAFLAAAALLYGGLHMLGRRDRMAAQRVSNPALSTPSTAPIPAAAAAPSTPTTAATAAATAAVEN